MADLLLIARVAGRRVAFPATDVEGVVELEGLTAVPGAAPHIGGLSALRSRVLTVIDCLASLGLGQSAAKEIMEAVVVRSGGHTYALLVDQVEDVVESAAAAVPVQAPLGSGWDRVAIGMVDSGGDLLLFADPHALIAGTVSEAA